MLIYDLIKVVQKLYGRRMLPFYKLFSLIVRVFARPLVNYTRKYHISNQSAEGSYLKIFFIRFGNLYHRIEMNINRRFLKMQSAYTFKPLNDELALEKGIEIFYEIMIYAILIGFSVFEMVVGSRETAAKKKALDERLNNYAIELGKMEDNVKKMEDQYVSVIDKQKQQIQDLEKQMNEISVPGYLEEMNGLGRKIGLQGNRLYRQLLLPF